MCSSKFVAALFLGLLFAAPAQAQVATYGSAAYSNAALTNSAVTVKATPALLTGINCYNPNAAVEYLQFFDTASTVVVGTTVPKFFVALAPTAVSNVAWPVGVNFSVSSLKFTATSTSTGAGAPGAALSCTLTYN
jgi:hypothetical protein